MLEHHEHSLATNPDEVNTPSHSNLSKDLVSYEEDDEDTPNTYPSAADPRAPAPIYMLDLSKVRSYQ